MFEHFILCEYYSKLRDILSLSETTKHHSINIQFLKLLDEDHKLGELLLNSPDEALCILNKQLDHVIEKIHGELLNDECKGLENVPKGKIHVRVYDLYFCPEFNFYTFPKVIEKNYVQVSGTVTRICAVKMLRCKRDFICQKCKESVTVCASYEQRYRIIAPKRCEAEGCNGRQMIEVRDVQPSYCKDYQEIKFQEDLSLIGSGVMPHSMWITLEDDLADICKPGDSITVCGVLKRRWSPLIKGKRAEVSLALQACHVAINNIPDGLTTRVTHNFADFWSEHRGSVHQCGDLRGRDVILRSFSPEIHGLYLVKLAVAVVLAGGGGSGGGGGGGDGGAARTRTEPHLLLVGDPGTGKSQLLRQAARIIPRSVCTTGIGSTSAGLTVTAIMEDGEWQLEAGAMVLSDGGICCIDEFNTMREHDRTSIHEAMEQQSISVAKASIVCKLNTRCSILAAANPQGPFDASKPLSSSLALASPLLSRFDLILPLKDRVDEARDSRVANFILDRFCSKSATSAYDCENSASGDDSDIWSMEILKDYYVHVRKLRPVLSERVVQILNAYYQYRRRMKCRNEARTTVRLLDSLVRLSKAHAKLMYREVVCVVDAVMAIVLLEAAGETEEGGGVVFDAQGEFPEDVEVWYRRVQEIIGNMLQMDLVEEVELNAPEIGKSDSSQNKIDSYEEQDEVEEDSCLNIHECSTRIEEQASAKDVEDQFKLHLTPKDLIPSTSMVQIPEANIFMEMSDSEDTHAQDGEQSGSSCNIFRRTTLTGTQSTTTTKPNDDSTYFPKMFGEFNADDFDIDV